MPQGALDGAMRTSLCRRPENVAFGVYENIWARSADSSPGRTRSLSNEDDRIRSRRLKFSNERVALTRESDRNRSVPDATFDTVNPIEEAAEHYYAVRLHFATALTVESTTVR
jgi:hypothetical protein